MTFFETQPVAGGTVPSQLTNGVALHVEISGRSDAAPIVLVHGSLDDLHGWQAILPYLEIGFRVVRYDRRGHGRSDAPPGQGRIGQDVDDLAGLASGLDLAPAHLVGHSYGGTVCLLAASRYPTLCASVTVHEPPLFGLLAGTEAGSEATRLAGELRDNAAAAVRLITGGAPEAGVRLFVDMVGFGPGTWATVLNKASRATFVAHAGTWVDQTRDPERLSIDLDGVAESEVPLRITHGDAGPPWYPPIVRALHRAVPSTLSVIHGSGHAPHLTHPVDFARTVVSHVEAVQREPK